VAWNIDASKGVEVLHPVSGYSICSIAKGDGGRRWECATGSNRIWVQITTRVDGIIDDEAFLRTLAARLSGNMVPWPPVIGVKAPAGGPERTAKPKPAPPATWTAEEQAAAHAMAATVAALGLTVLANLLLRVRAGLPRNQKIADLMNALRGRLPADPFEAWKQKYTSMGWRYVEENGVARFLPPEGQTVSPPAPREGQVDAATGKVWSENAREWQSRDYYEQERARVARFEAGLAAERQAAAEANRTASQAWSARTAGMAQDIANQRAAIDEAYRLRGQIDGVLDKLEARERASGDLSEDRELLLERMRQRMSDLVSSRDPASSVEELKRLGRLAIEQGQPGFEPTYTYRDALVDSALEGGAVISDVLLTRGAATAGLAAYRGTTNALEAGASVPGAVLSGVTSGVTNLATGQFVGAGMQKLSEIPAMANLIQKGNSIELSLFSRSTGEAEAAAGTRIWGSGMKAVRDEATRKGLLRLPSDSAAYETGAINEALANAGPRFNARRVDAFSRLDSGDPLYQRGIDALTRDPRLLTPEARIAADAVRQDLKLRAVEDALESLYTKDPALRGSITGIQNTGSHALKGANYRNLDSDIDFTPLHNGTEAGRQAASELSGEIDNSLHRLSGGKLGADDLKINVYGNNAGRGAFRSEGGLKVKDMLNQTSGTIDKVDGTRITHTLNGGDPVEIGQGTRWTSGGAAGDTRQLADFRADCLNKYREELPEMGSPQERLHQASKLYRLSRTMEAKSVDGRALGGSDSLLSLARGKGAGMSAAEQEAAANRLLDALEKGL